MQPIKKQNKPKTHKQDANSNDGSTAALSKLTLVGPQTPGLGDVPWWGPSSAPQEWLSAL